MMYSPDVVILVVDDEENIVHSLVRQIMDMGYNVKGTSSGKDALDIIQTEHVGIILCDQKMPIMSGPQILEQVCKLSPFTQRISITGYSEIDMIVEAINLGKTQHFLLKPWKKENLEVILDVSYHQYMLAQEKEALQKINEEQNLKLKELSARLIRFSHNQRTTLGDSWALQNSLLIDELPSDLEGVEIAAKTLPAQDLDGDFIFCHDIDSGVVDIVIGDVMGKGLTAALTAASLRGYFMHEWGRAEGLGYEKHTPRKIISMVSKAIAERLLEFNSFVSLLYLRVDLGRRVLSYVDCGSVKPLLFKSRNDDVSTLECDNCPLGIPEGGKAVEEGQIDVEDGDTIVLFSDGVVEETDATGKKVFGESGVISCLSDHFSDSPSAIISKLFEELNNFRGDIRQHDDLTCIAMKFGSCESQAASTFSSTFRHDMEVELESSYNELDHLHDLVSDACRKCNIDVDREGKVVLAVHEAFVNIIKHSYGAEQDKPVWLSWYSDNEFMHIALYDYGISFNLENSSNPDFSGNSESGFGLHIITEIADKVIYDIDNKARNFMQLSFKIGDR